jgi:hypothetical protein
MTYSKHFRGGGVVTIIIGPDEKEFTVHKDLLVFYSDYFRVAFNGSFIEATEKKIDLFDIDHKVFEYFHAWLYTRKLIPENNEPLKWADLIGLWIFGDRFQMPMLQNCIMDEIFAMYDRKESLSLHILKAVYQDTIDGSPLRKAMMEILAYNTELGDENGSSMTAGCRKFFTLEILQDLVKAVDTARKNKVPYGKISKRGKCFFHVHDKDEHC